MTLTPYDEGYFDGYFGSRPNNPYRRGTGTPDIEAIASKWDAGYSAGAAKAEAETRGLSVRLDRLGDIIRGTP
jgi:hypothetical protein